MQDRHRTGIPGLDEHLDGGLIPGTLAVLVGATGIGKTQFSLQYALEGLRSDKELGLILDLTARGDSQNHAAYLKTIGDVDLRSGNSSEEIEYQALQPGTANVRDYMSLFRELGRPPSKAALTDSEWDEWKSLLNRKLQKVVGFLYHRLVQGCRRIVIDGFEPTRANQDSIQFELFEYLYQQVLRKECDWVARDLYRENFRGFHEMVREQSYRHDEVTCVASCTSHAHLLSELIASPLQDGDLLANANTLIYMGKTVNGDTIGRGLYIAKHRGSRCSEQIIPYTISDDGICVS